MAEVKPSRGGKDRMAKKWAFVYVRVWGRQAVVVCDEGGSHAELIYKLQWIIKAQKSLEDKLALGGKWSRRKGMSSKKDSKKRRPTFGESKTGNVEGVQHPLTKVKGEVDGRWEQRVVGPEWERIWLYRDDRARTRGVDLILEDLGSQLSPAMTHSWLLFFQIHRISHMISHINLPKLMQVSHSDLSSRALGFHILTGPTFTTLQVSNYFLLWAKWKWMLWVQRSTLAAKRFLYPFVFSASGLQRKSVADMFQESLSGTTFAVWGIWRLITSISQSFHQTTNLIHIRNLRRREYLLNLTILLNVCCSICLHNVTNQF